MKSADGALLDAGTVLFERSDLVGKVNTGCELLAEQVFFDLVVARGLRYMATLDLSSDSDDPDAVIASLGFEIAFSTLGWEYGHTSFQRVVLDGGDVTVCVDRCGDRAAACRGSQHPAPRLPDQASPARASGNYRARDVLVLGVRNSPGRGEGSRGAPLG